ncbi:DUF2155 domain-containing protein [Rhodoblastus acidophilus]|uniref:DUF2155 domain-containing protein n=1 Tax=Rhodoblastus acidophilus TaxID=1074 RepID=A0A6N8DKP2_RHOAC|nr:DUF2155 domain-containing protein [Rhodoblastus acidophilus]MCW2273835.1 hypothetical protein [Rhodoblastus acidophilus]MTV31019.1 DUF2155 domain-containing protein [Rhodoblastus acidophilus]
MRLSFLALCLAAGLLAGPSARADQIRNPNAVFAGLDKITGRIISFDVAIDETVQFGTLQITPRVCLTRPQTENPLTEGFVEVDDVESAKTAKRIFSGWMFAASPGLHGVEHPVYDIWLKDCKGGKDVIASPAPGTPAATPPNAQSSPTPVKKPRILKPQEPEEPKVEAPSSSAESPPPAEPVDMGSPPAGPAPLPPPVEVGAPPGAGADPGAQPPAPKPKKKPKPKPPPPTEPPQAQPAPQPQPRAPEPRGGFPNLRDLF